MGILCTRLGTPTPRPLSGTVEEFEDASRRWLETRSPHILFYFCKQPRKVALAANPDGIAQVRDFRQRYPGLFTDYRGLDDLARLFQVHLIREVLALRFAGPPVNNPPGMAGGREWVTPFVRTIDHTPSGSAPTYLDWSSRRPARILARLEAVFDLGRVLTPEERRILAAASYARVLRRRAEALGPPAPARPP